jgi:PIN domain nuclease of toxin-antitoxin system
MKYLWDTHALIWGMENDPLLSRQAQTIAGQNGNAVSCITLWEVACLEHLRRIKFSIPLAEWLDAISERLQVLPITPRIAAVAYDLGSFRGDAADRLIAGTAIVYGLRVVTRDKYLQTCPKLDCVWD